MGQNFCYRQAMTEEKRGRGRPATGVTKKRDVRIGDVWDQAAELAAADGEKMPALVTRLLTEYVAAKKG